MEEGPIILEVEIRQLQDSLQVIQKGVAVHVEACSRLGGTSS